jgi:glycosyltransferase involved in cell wall biosynthesis
VSDFLKRLACARIIIEKKPGLTSARIAGIKAAKYEWLIFFDDDNEPNTNYLQKVVLSLNQYPTVGAWGPGEIEVEFTHRVPIWLCDEKHLFQQRKEEHTKFASQAEWQEFYPFGTGLIIRRDIAEIYAKRVHEKRYTLSDRKGKSLASGGDVQLVLTGIEQSYGAGVVSGLKLTHLIDGSKTRMKYLLKMQYGTASAYVKAYNQVFENAKIPIEEISGIQVLWKIYSLYRIHGRKMKREQFKLFFATKMGEINARFEASGVSKPLLLRFYEKRIRVS